MTGDFSSIAVQSQSKYEYFNTLITAHIWYWFENVFFQVETCGL